MENRKNGKKNCTIVHPNLGIGGAERLILDVAHALESSGHSVRMVTGRYDPDYCFIDSKELDITVPTIINLIPLSIFGHFIALCTYIRMILCAIYCLIGILLNWYQTDLFICDQISVCIPFLKLSKKPVIYYGHFPDQLLCVERSNVFHKFYRFFIDLLEVKTTGLSDLILANSKFTKETYLKTIPNLNEKQIEILYPTFQKEFKKNFTEDLKKEMNEMIFKKEVLNESDIYVLSINRYERKKNIGLAIQAFGLMRSHENYNIHLLHIGGYDLLCQENIEYKKELEDLIDSDWNLNEKIKKKIHLSKSIVNEKKDFLLRNCRFLVYTPENEHFGIVPLEAMANGKPVLACTSGGPLETVAHIGGWLCEPNVELWAKMMDEAVEKSKSMKEQCIQQADQFSFDNFEKKLNGFISRFHST
ncbi:hypothetical protein SNEBB_007284 [Seison nebaliae]|nr:hypothetical protein SNEBB_007284 [Seison nebaliae]